MRKVVMLSLDAFFDQDLAVSPEGDALTSFLEECAVCSEVKTVFPALTYPAHATLITGCDPSGHGIGQNQPFQPRTDKRHRAWYWDAAALRKPTIFDAVQAAGGKCASVFWPVTGRLKSIRWNMPEVAALPGENQLVKIMSYGTPAWMASMEMKYGRDRSGIQEPKLSNYAARVVMDVVKHHQPDLTCAHLIDLDEMRHQYGTFSEEAKAAIHRHGERVEQVWQTMQATRGMEDALLVLVSDHGQADVDRTVCLSEVLKEANLGGCVQVQSCGMSAYLFGGAEVLARASEWMQSHPEVSGVSQVYGREELARMGCAAGPSMAVEAAPGVVFSDMLEEKKREKATHGFGPGHSAENCLLAVRGAGVRRGAVLPSMPMRDVAPTVAGLMGLTMPACEGKDHSQEILEETGNA